ncbi:hypothetical protein C8Q76DRAFT_635615, partial [Earliella scabrosa]
MALIRVLPVKYNSLWQTLLLNDSLTLEKLQDTFVVLENQLSASLSLLVLSHATSAVTCTFCSHQNHSEAECYSNHNTSTKAKEKATRRISSRVNPRRKENTAEASKDTSETPQEFTGVVTVSAGCASVLLSVSDCALWLSSLAAANWNTNTGASAHMTLHCHWFCSYSLHTIPIHLANSHIIYLAGLGSVVFQPAERDSVQPPAVVLHDVLHVSAL